MTLRKFIKSTDEFTLSYLEKGSPSNDAFLFLHGLAQSSEIWRKVIENPFFDNKFVIAPDLRGHGESDKTISKKAYQNSDVWADDIEAILLKYNINKVVIIAWSYAGYVVCDYIRKYGENKIKAINFIAAAVKLNKSFDMVGNGLLGNFTKLTSKHDIIRQRGIKQFINEFFEKEPDFGIKDELINTGELVSVFALEAMTSRYIDNADVLASISVPVLNSYAIKDSVILASMGEYIASLVKHVQNSIYEDAGHAMFIDDEKRFLIELEQFVNE